MQQATLRFDSDFQVVSGNERSQAAVMVLGPAESTGGPHNRHRDSDQWLYVVSGSGEAVIDGQIHDLSAGTLVLIERGETHEIRNTGTGPLQTLNVYVPPAYTQNGDALPAGKD